LIHIHDVHQERTLLAMHSVACGEFTTYC